MIHWTFPKTFPPYLLEFLLIGNPVQFYVQDIRLLTGTQPYSASYAES